jgi:hypothetical protein
MYRRQGITTDELYMIGVYMALVLVFIAVMFSSCVRGPQGIQGPAGITPVVTTAPASYLNCPFGGTDVTIGNSVTIICNGATGSQGPQGPSGSPGTNGTVVNIIQLCPGFTPTYPSSFPEVALCIDNQLYGVYSANDGFLSLLTPGTYTSDGINASCTLTILPNCVVQ